MKLISHRGNISGPNPQKENHPNYILNALNKGYEVEIDVWYTNKFMLGHDKPQYEFPFDLLEKFYTKLWVHCKNIEAIVKLKNNPELNSRLNYFWHENDSSTITSKGYIWTYPNSNFYSNKSVNVDLGKHIKKQNCYGVCSDYVQNLIIL